MWLTPRGRARAEIVTSPDLIPSDPHAVFFARSQDSGHRPVWPSQWARGRWRRGANAPPFRLKFEPPSSPVISLERIRLRAETCVERPRQRSIEIEPHSRIRSTSLRNFIPHPVVKFWLFAETHDWPSAGDVLALIDSISIRITRSISFLRLITRVQLALLRQLGKIATERAQGRRLQRNQSIREPEVLTSGLFALRSLRTLRFDRRPLMLRSAMMIQPNLARSSVMKMRRRRSSCSETRTCATNLASFWRCWTTASARLSSSDSGWTTANRKLSKKLERNSE
jgi:hypothetical protein